MAALARLKPHNPRKGFLLQTWSAPDMPVFKSDAGWYEVSDDQADILAEVLSRPEDLTSQPAFDIVKTKEAAQTIERMEQRALTQKADPEAPIRMHAITRSQASAAGSRGRVRPEAEGVLTTADLPENQKADTTDSLEGTEADLDVDDLSALASLPSSIPGAPDAAPATRGGAGRRK